MFGIGPWEFVLILVIALLVVGPKRLPELLRDLGKMLAQVRNLSDDMRRELKLDDELRNIQSTVRDLQDVSTSAMRKMMKEVEEETAVRAAEENDSPPAEVRSLPATAGETPEAAAFSELNASPALSGALAPALEKPGKASGDDGEA